VINVTIGFRCTYLRKNLNEWHIGHGGIEGKELYAKLQNLRNKLILSYCDKRRSKND